MALTNLTAAIITANGLLLFLSVYWTTASWQAVHSQRGAPPWKPYACTPTHSAVTSRHGRFRNLFNVTLASITPPAKPPLFAFRYGSPIFNQSRTSAVSFAKSIPINRSTTCFVEQPRVIHNVPYAYRLSLSPVNTSPSRAELAMAIISTVFTITTSIGLLVLFACVVFANPPEATPQPANVARSPPVKCFSRVNVERLCELFADEHARRSERTLEVCPICLDDEDMESRMALLPCDHRFHMKCVRGWLFRGGLTCPLCNLQLGGDGKLSDPHTADDDPLPTRAVVVPEDAFVDGSVTGTLLGAPSPGLSSQSATEEPEGRNLRESVSTTTKSPPSGASSVAARDFE